MVSNSSFRIPAKNSSTSSGLQMARFEYLLGCLCCFFTQWDKPILLLSFSLHLPLPWRNISKSQNGKPGFEASRSVDHQWTKVANHILPFAPVNFRLGFMLLYIHGRGKTIADFCRKIMDVLGQELLTATQKSMPIQHTAIQLMQC